MCIFYSIRQTFQESKKKREIFFYTVTLFKGNRGVISELKPLFRVVKYFRTYPPEFRMEIIKKIFLIILPPLGDDFNPSKYILT